MDPRLQWSRRLLCLELCREETSIPCKWIYDHNTKFHSEPRPVEYLLPWENFELPEEPGAVLQPSQWFGTSFCEETQREWYGTFQRHKFDNWQVLELNWNAKLVNDPTSSLNSQFGDRYLVAFCHISWQVSSLARENLQSAQAMHFDSAKDGHQSRRYHQRLQTPWGLRRIKKPIRTKNLQVIGVCICQWTTRYMHTRSLPA